MNLIDSYNKLMQGHSIIIVIKLNYVIKIYDLYHLTSLLVIF